jgi:uncharacterized protein (DUF2237 family)
MNKVFYMALHIFEVLKIQLIMMIFLFSLGSTAMATDDNKNVLGEPLVAHTGQYTTGFYRDGYCRTDIRDTGQHAIAATVTKEFLDYTKSRGNDLQTPRPGYRFPGLKPGDNWCLCTARWKEAEQAGVEPP